MTDTRKANDLNRIREPSSRWVCPFNEPIDPDSILSGWTGSSTVVTLLNQVGGSSNDTVTIYDQADSAQLPFGTVDLGRKDYTTATVSFTGSSMVMSGSTISITLGTAGGAGATTANNNATMTWTPSTTPTDRAGNACSATAATEVGGADKEF